MQINIPDETIEQMVKEQVNISVRKRIKEMQGNYTSKGYIENIISEVIWDKILKLCPDVEKYIKSEVERCVDHAFSRQGELNFTKRQLVEEIVSNLLEEL
ncbi:MULTISPECIES: hypothetical protein [unclassified Clostridium]|uniref:hypothetical protein n=1 Tax=unclassified Clostridium TaxID=2614128 RepID=UPI0025B85112|nr:MULTISPECIES: hypothetical protein [unclassified Clostridium]